MMRAMRGMILALVFIAGCGPSTVSSGDGGHTGPDADSCTPGAARCLGTTWQICTSGTWDTQADCLSACDPTHGCVVCTPGTGSCSGNTSHACKADGSGYVDQICDPLEGVTCNVDSGQCVGDCAPDKIGQSYIGCEYYPTVTGNDVDNAFEFAVAVSNTSSAVANVDIEDGGLVAPITFTVNPGDVVVQKLPWQAALKLCNDAPGGLECGQPQTTNDVLASKGAFHLRSTEPVTVYQFNPLDYANAAGQFSYTNDASLLIPTNAWTGNYVAAAYPAWPFAGTPWPSELAITAAQDGTSVMITSKAITPGGTGVPALQPGVPGTVMLNAGDVLELTSIDGSVNDLTGSIVAADKPVQLIGGHYCTQVPNGITACDHIEESMFPIETLSTKYIVTPPAVPSPGFEMGKVEIVRIIATAADTQLTYDPPQAFPTNLANAGDFIEIPNTVATFQVTSNHKVMIAQYMEGQDAGGGVGDPAMALAVAVDQYRMDYQFHAPVNYSNNYVNVTAPMGANITLDGVPLSAGAFMPIGGTGYGIDWIVLGTGIGGNHVINGDMKFGISVYGYGQYTSYWYPGGLNLGDIPVSKPAGGK